MSETAILRDVLAAVTALPDAMFWRANTGVGVTAARQVVKFNVAGCPDIIGVHRGRAVGIEVKTARGRQSPQQRRFQIAWERAGGLYLIARSANDALAKLA